MTQTPPKRNAASDLHQRVKKELTVNCRKPFAANAHGGLERDTDSSGITPISVEGGEKSGAVGGRNGPDRPSEGDPAIGQTGPDSVPDSGSDLAQLLEAARSAVELTARIVGLNAAEAERLQQARHGLISALACVDADR